MCTKMCQVNNTISVYTYCQFNYFRTVLPEPEQGALWHRNPHIKLNTFHLPYIYFADGAIITFSSGSGMSGSSGKTGLTTRL